MKNLPVFAVAFAVVLAGLMQAPGAAAADFACMEDCFRQGYARGYCQSICGGRPAPGLLDQPGLPKNPAFDELEQKSRPAQRALPPVADPKCVDACRRNGYNYSLCRRQCSY